MKDNIRELMFSLLKKSISDDYVGYIIDNILDDVVNDVKETADPEEWNEDDIKLAIGRVILDKIGADY